MTSRELNWAGNSIYTVAAIYETDAAAREFEEDLVSWRYMEAAWLAEQSEMLLDEVAHASR